MYFLPCLLLHSISSFASLKKLDLSGNDLAGDETLADKLARLKALMSLALEDCNLSEIPER